MERQCPACGARVSDEMKICGNCGKILPQRRTSSPQANSANMRRKNSAQQRVNTARAAGAAVNNTKNREREQINRQPQKRPTVQREAPTRQVSKKEVRQAEARRQKSSQSIWQRFNIKKWIKIAVVVVIIYVVVSAIQVFRVRFSTYEFKTTDMKMSRENYGQAIDGFFDSGHWVYNPFTFTVRYSGKSEGKEYDLKFSAFASVDLKSIEVDGDKKEESQIEPIVMGMFI